MTRNTPGQKDLTRFTFDDASPAGTVVVGFNSDKTGFSGNNTGDGCFLFDTDGDGNANSAVCVTVGGDPAVLLTTRIFLCGDGSVFKCTNPQTEVTTFTTSCSAGQTNTDPFPTGDGYPADTTVTCNIVLAEVGVGAVLIDVCSYPSQQPNSDPSDCVVSGTGPTAVTLRSFAAAAGRDGVVLRWRTGSEVGTLGFNVYRVNKAGKRVKLNGAVIAASASVRGASYRFVDRAAARPGTRYWLQEVTLRGTRSWVSSASA